MNEDYKYLLASYQNTASELFTQSIAVNAKIRQLNDVINAQNEKIQEQEKELEKLSKVKNTTRSTKVITKDSGTF